MSAGHLAESIIAQVEAASNSRRGHAHAVASEKGGPSISPEGAPIEHHHITCRFQQSDPLEYWSNVSANTQV